MITGNVVFSAMSLLWRLTQPAVPAHDTFTVQSAALGESRLINVYTPPQYRGTPTSAAGRLPVLYMPDGGLDEDFPHVVHTVDSLMALGRIRPVIVVGIPNTERRRDLTGPTRIAKDSAIAPRVGGSAAFRRFLRDELIPEIGRRYATTTERAIIGESLAGLFIVETFMVEPTLFTHAMALDPSVWWNGGAIVDSAAVLLMQRHSGARTLYLATSGEPSTAVGSAQLAKTLGLLSLSELMWSYVPRPDLTHATIYRALEADAIVYALHTTTVNPPTPPSTPAAQPPTASQNPSPMVESTRRHERLTERLLKGTKRTFVGPASKPVAVFVPTGLSKRRQFDLVVHFHGAAWLPEQAVTALNNHTVAATVNIGTGSGGYDRAFADTAAFDSLLADVTREVEAAVGHPAQIGSVTLTAWSAGHGAVRAIIRNSRHFATVSAILLIDGMHTSYVPEGKVLSLGGTIDTTNLVAFTNFAQAAMRGDKRFLVTHSEIFPGTFVSTTETADWMLGALGLKRTTVLRWGPRGTQQLSEVRSGRFTLLGFAGNSAPDHVDQFHALPELLARLVKQ